MSKKTSRFLAVAAASLALSFGAAFAAQPQGASGPDAMGHHGGPGWHHGGFMKELNQLHGQLKLNADQEKAWQAAVDTFKQMQQQPILDLNAMHTAHQQLEQKDQQIREQTAQAWLNFYNGLNDQQKTTVSAAIKQHFAKMEQRHEKMHQRWEQHRGAAGAAPASAPQQ
jgi:periplasmic protein CpxP/Spy